MCQLDPPSGSSDSIKDKTMLLIISYVIGIGIGLIVAIAVHNFLDNEGYDNFTDIGGSVASFVVSSVIFGFIAYILYYLVMFAIGILILLGIIDLITELVK